MFSVHEPLHEDLPWPTKEASGVAHQPTYEREGWVAFKREAHLESDGEAGEAVGGDTMDDSDDELKQRHTWKRQRDMGVSTPSTMIHLDEGTNTR